MKCGLPRRDDEISWLGGNHAGRLHPARGEAWIRVNQVGYLPDDPKIAVLSSDEPLTGEFQVGDFTADIGADQGAWGPFAHNYRLDFSDVKSSGRVSSDVWRGRIAEVRDRRRRLRGRAGEAARVHAAAALRREPGHRGSAISRTASTRRPARWSTWSAAGTTRPIGSST